MVAIPNIPGLEVTVRVNNQALKEYESSYAPIGGPNAERTTVRYIETMPGAEYSIRLSVSPEYVYDSSYVVCNIRIDGQDMCGKATSKSRHKSLPLGENLDHEGHHSQSLDGKQILTKFSFAPIKITENDYEPRMTVGKNAMEKVGKIEVLLTRANKMEVVDCHQPVFVPPKLSNVETEVSEKLLKGLTCDSHTISGTSKEVSFKFARFIELEGDDKLIAIAEFKYRSRDALKIEGILDVPRSPRLDDFEQLSATEREALVRRMYEMQRTPAVKDEMKGPRRTIKREYDLTLDDDSDEVSQADSRGKARAFKQTRMTSVKKTKIEVIDLTD